MNDWLREFIDNNTGRNYWYNTEIYNPSKGILYLYPILGFGSIALTFYCFEQFIKDQEVFVPTLLGIISLLLGLAGLIMSIMNIPYSFRTKSIHMVGGCILGVFFSLGGILYTIMLYIYMFVPKEVIFQIVGY